MRLREFDSLHRLQFWRVRFPVRSPASQAGQMGSTPLRVANYGHGNRPLRQVQDHHRGSGPSLHCPVRRAGCARPLVDDQPRAGHLRTVPPARPAACPRSSVVESGPGKAVTRVRFSPGASPLVLFQAVVFNPAAPESGGLAVWVRIPPA